MQPHEIEGAIALQKKMYEVRGSYEEKKKEIESNYSFSWNISFWQLVLFCPPCEVLMVLSDVSHYFSARPSHTNKDAPIVKQPPRGWITCDGRNCAEEAAATNKSVRDAMIPQSDNSQTRHHFIILRRSGGGRGRSISLSFFFFIILLTFLFTCLFPCTLCINRDQDIIKIKEHRDQTTYWRKTFFFLFFFKALAHLFSTRSLSMICYFESYWMDVTNNVEWQQLDNNVLIMLLACHSVLKETRPSKKKSSSRQTQDPEKLVLRPKPIFNTATLLLLHQHEILGVRDVQREDGGGGERRGWLGGGRSPDRGVMCVHVDACCHLDIWAQHLAGHLKRGGGGGIR